mmetsp:Transcript_1094/g.3012  ORF Transcript_1094/g.3012 Transcript_1094/m.3012 type:complete len:238 (+) Transcript_1094:1464-2177(+)
MLDAESPVAMSDRMSDLLARRALAARARAALAARRRRATMRCVSRLERFESTRYQTQKMHSAHTTHAPPVMRAIVFESSPSCSVSVCCASPADDCESPPPPRPWGAGGGEGGRGGEGKATLTGVKYSTGSKASLTALLMSSARVSTNSSAPPRVETMEGGTTVSNSMRTLPGSRLRMVTLSLSTCSTSETTVTNLSWRLRPVVEEVSHLLMSSSRRISATTGKPTLGSARGETGGGE